jgi:hypothetical protein
MQAMIIFAIETGMRLGRDFVFKWSDIQRYGCIKRDQE